MRILILISILLTGCTTQLINPDNISNPSKGLVLLSAYCQQPVTYLLVFKKGRSANNYTKYSSDKDILCGKNETFGINKQGVKLMDLDQGDYFIGSVGGHVALHFETPMSFTVVPNTITYLGSIDVKLLQTKNEYKTSTHYISIDINDSEDMDKESILKIYPNIFEKFKYKKSLLIKSM